MKQIDEISGYRFNSADSSHTHDYLLPTVNQAISSHFSKNATERRRVFDVGCGNGAMAAKLVSTGYEVIGVDPSSDGISIARKAYPQIDLRIGSAYEDLSATFGTFPVVLSLEVVEHLYAPRDFAATVFKLVEPGGIAIVSTPYHGYIKNLVLAASGKLDAHFTALWDHGHIKFWSIKTLEQLLREAGFDRVEIYRVGRFPILAKSMIAVAHKC